MVRGKALRRDGQLLKSIAAELFISPKSIWKDYRSTLSGAAADQRGRVRRCDFGVGASRCQHSVEDNIQFYYVPIGDNKRVLECMGYSNADVNKLVAKGRKRLNCCACHQHGRPSNASLPGSAICHHFSIRSRRLSQKRTLFTSSEQELSTDNNELSLKRQQCSVVIQKLVRGWTARRRSSLRSAKATKLTRWWRHRWCRVSWL